MVFAVAALGGRLREAERVHGLPDDHTWPGDKTGSTGSPMEGVMHFLCTLRTAAAVV